MLTIEPHNRASLDDLLKSKWVTNNNKEIISCQTLDENDQDRQGFGNIKRLITKTGSYSNLLSKKENKSNKNKDDFLL